VHLCSLYGKLQAHWKSTCRLETLGKVIEETEAEEGEVSLCSMFRDASCTSWVTTWLPCRSP